MKIKVIDNLKNVKDINYITLYVNNLLVWVSKNTETNKQVIDILESPEYKLVVKLDNKEIDSIIVKDIKGSYIVIRSSKLSPLLGLKGIIWGPLINLFRKKYKIKIRSSSK